MLRSLFSGVSGMKSNQTKMDVIGNNIANVNTTAFKSGRVTFKDMLSQTVQTANAPSQGRGGLNPKQVGLGVAVAGVDTNMSQGGLQPTGRATDLAIEGNGFYIISDGNETRYTRDGSLTLDKDGNLITADGYHVMGLSNSNINTAQFDLKSNDTTDYKQLISGKVTNLNALKIPLEAINSGTTSTNKLKQLTFAGFTFDFGTGTDLKDYKIVTGTVADGTAPSASVDTTAKTITINGDFDNTTNAGMITNAQLQSAISTALAAKSIAQTVTVTGTATAGTATNSSSSTIALNTSNSGTASNIIKLTSFGVETDGSITAVYGDKTIKIGQIALAAFQNAAGLTKMGGNTYMQSLNSGDPVIGSAASSGYGNIQQGMLEMSNVDLASEFTEMIITSRAYQANSRTIQTSDEMLQELLNLKR